MQLARDVTCCGGVWLFIRRGMLRCGCRGFCWLRRRFVGLWRVILWRHVLPNVMLPLVTLLGLSLGSLLGGTAVVEIIYNWPGMGNMAVKAISCRDYPLVQGYVLWIAILYMCINLLVDLSYTYLDPRLKEDR